MRNTRSEERIRSRRARRRRGSSLVEVLIAFAILLILMAGVLQVFSLALQTNFGSGARTTMTFKARQVIENLRVIQALHNRGRGEMATAAGITMPLTASTTPVRLPFKNGDTGFAFWGPSGAQIIGDENYPNGYLPYRLEYRVADNGPTWAITVSVIPVDAPGETAPTGAQVFLTGGSKVKRVDYVGQLRKQP